MQDTERARIFSSRVVIAFGTQVVAAGIAIINGILLARILGPAAKGDYYLLILLPTTVAALTLLGLPQAFGFFAAKGRTDGMVRKAIVSAVALASVGVAVTLLLLPVLRDAVLHGLGLDEILLALLALPLSLGAAFTGAVVMGRQAVRWYAAVSLAVPIATTILIVGILIGLGPSVLGAVAVYLLALSIQATGFAIAARHESLSAQVRAIAPVGEPAPAGGLDEPPKRVSYRELLAYALPFYLANLPVHFSYRIDGYLIAFLMVGPSTALGYYSMAVALAELVLFFPDAVSILFFPHVAGAAREESDRQVAMVSRVTMLISAVVALPLVPASAFMISVLLPAFGPSLPPFLILLPGVVALSASKVVAGYMAGINRPGVRAVASFSTLVVNIATNFALIPRYGISGAAAASLVSYTFSALLNTAIASRITGARLWDFWIPRPSDFRFLLATTVALLRRLRDRSPTVQGRLSA